MLHNSELVYLKVRVMPCEASASPQVKHLKASNPRSTTIILHPRSEPGTGIAHARLFESIWLFFFSNPFRLAAEALFSAQRRPSHAKQIARLLTSTVHKFSRELSAIVVRRARILTPRRNTGM
jgi:hypothetical protein